MVGVRARPTGRLALAFVLLCTASQVAALDGSETVETLAGGENGDGFPATIASTSPDGVSVGPDGSIYIAESANQRIRRINPQTGTIETIAGTGGQGFSGDGGPAVAARLSYPTSAVADAFGNVYICDQSNQRVRRIAPNGIISTVAGTGAAGFADGHATTVAKLYFPRSLAVDSNGNVLIAEPFNQRIRFLNVAGASVSTVAGTGVGGFSGENGQATAAKLQLPAAVWSLGPNTFLIADQANHRIRRVETNGVIRTVAGNGSNGYSGENGAATGAALSSPVSVSARSDGSFVFADQGNNRVRRVTSSGTIQLVAGTGSAGFNGDSFQANQAQLNRPSGISYDSRGDCVIADSDNQRVRVVVGCVGTGTIDTLAGIPSSFTGDGWPAAAAVLTGPSDVTQDTLGNVYIADFAAHRVRMVRTNGFIETYAGTGQPGDSGDGGPATSAMLKQPNRLAVDLAGNLLILDTGNRKVRRVNAATRTITTIAGNGNWGSTGDGGQAVNASFMYPLGMTVDGAGRIYIADASARRIRMIDQTGTIWTIAGTGVPTDSIDGPGGNPTDNLGDFGQALAASFIAPCDVAVDQFGTLYVADMTAHRVRQIDASGIIRPLAGTGTGTGRVDGEGGSPADDLNDGEAASTASLYTPVGVDVTSFNDVVIADQANRRLRIIRDGIIETLGGNGYVTWSVDGEGGQAHDDLGDGGDVSNATFISLSSVFVDAFDNLLVTDSQAERVRMIGSSGPPPATATAVPPTATPIPPTPTRTPTFTTIPSTPTHTHTPGASTSSVSGRVRYYANQQIDVPNVEVDLTGPTTATVQTDSRGSYNANSIPTGSWNLAPGKSGGFGSAISSLDAARVLQVVAGLQSFNAMQRLACDVTGDGNLSALDAVRILQFSAGVIGRMPVADVCGSDWLFDPEPAAPGQTIPPVVGSGACQQGRILINPLVNPANNQNFDAILFGDCTGNWGPAVGGALRRNSGGGAGVHVGRGRQARTGSVRFPVYVQAQAPFQALDVAVAFDANAATFSGARLSDRDSAAIVSAGSQRPGIATVSLASGTPIEANDGVVLLLEFSGVEKDECPGVRLAGATVDERSARVVTHFDCD